MNIWMRLNNKHTRPSIIVHHTNKHKSTCFRTVNIADKHPICQQQLLGGLRHRYMALIKRKRWGTRNSSQGAPKTMTLAIWPHSCHRYNGSISSAAASAVGDADVLLWRLAWQWVTHLYSLRQMISRRVRDLRKLFVCRDEAVTMRWRTYDMGANRRLSRTLRCLCPSFLYCIEYKQQWPAVKYSCPWTRTLEITVHVPL